MFHSRATKEYKFVIFDWDGTLMDSTSRIVSCMQATAKIAGLPIPNEKQVKGVIGLSMDAVIQKIFPKAPAGFQQSLKDIYRQQYVEIDQTPSPLFGGSLELLNWLKSRNVEIAVATGKARAGLSRALSSVNLLDYFPHSICADEAHSKPHPQMIHSLLSRTGYSAGDTLVIGDSVHDLGMANNAKVDSVGVSTGANTHQELSELAPLCILEKIDHLKSFLNH